MGLQPLFGQVAEARSLLLLGGGAAVPDAAAVSRGFFLILLLALACLAQVDDCRHRQRAPIIFSGRTISSNSSAVT